MTHRENLQLKWEKLAGRSEPEIDSFKELVYDTYKYFSQSREFNSVLRDDLPIFHLMCVFSRLDFAPGGYRESHYRCCQITAEALCLTTEAGFKRGYFKESLHFPKTHIVPDEADMSSFESFSKCFATCLECYEESYAESEEEYWDDCEDDD